MAEDDELRAEELVEEGGGSADEEAAAEQFMLDWSQASEADLRDASLKHQWNASSHVLGCTKGLHAAQLAIYASKAIEGADLREIQQAARAYATAGNQEKAEKMQGFKEIFSEMMAKANVEVPKDLRERVKKRRSESRQSTPSSTPNTKRPRSRSAKEKQPAIITEGLTVNPFTYLSEMREKEVNP